MQPLLKKSVADLPSASVPSMQSNTSASSWYQVFVNHPDTLKGALERLESASAVDACAICCSLLLGDQTQAAAARERFGLGAPSTAVVPTGPALPAVLNTAEPWVPTPSAASNLSALALGMVSGRPLLLQGPPGAGKTALVRALAACAQRPLLELHLDDSMDSKTLLGTYVCTDVPGEFKWAAGVVTQAVMAGEWVVIEDLDRAPFEVLSVLVPLLRSRTLIIPGRDVPLVAAPGFCLFATRGTKARAAGHAPEAAAAASGSGSSTTAAAAATHMLEDMGAADAAAQGSSASASLAPFLSAFHTVTVAPPSRAELDDMLASRCPGLSHSTAARMLATYAFLQRAHHGDLAAHPVGELSDSDSDLEDAFEAAAREAVQGEDDGDSPLALAKRLAVPAELARLARYGRVLSPRDLFKWAGRVKRHLIQRAPAAAGAEMPDYLTDAQRHNILRESVDVFLGHLPNATLRAAGAGALAPLWGIPPQEAAEDVTGFHPRCVLLTESLSGAAAAVQVGDIRMEVHRSLGSLHAGDAVPEAPAGRSDGLVEAGSPLPPAFAPTRHSAALLRALAVGIAQGEPLLLVGETGNGKTSVIQALAQSTGNTLLVQNLNVQSDSADLLGGYKPIHMKAAAVPVVEAFLEAFNATFRQSDNSAYLGVLHSALEKGAWSKLVKAVRKGVASAAGKLGGELPQQVAAIALGTDAPAEEDAAAEGTRAHPESTEGQLQRSWIKLARRIEAFERQRAAADSAFAFAFAEGALVRALTEGHWMLLDELNLASRETLERLAGLLDGPQGTLSLTERGDAGAIQRHPNFRLFGAMNPATDAGKRDLPPGIRQRFTELWVDEVVAPGDLAVVAGGFLNPMYGMGTAAAQGPDEKKSKKRVTTLEPAVSSMGIGPPIAQVVNFHLAARHLAAGHLTDGAAQRPRYSLRSLCRALGYASHLVSGAAGGGYAPQRALYEGFCMSYLTQLDAASADSLHKEIVKHLLDGKALSSKALSKPPRKPGGRRAVVVNPTPSGGEWGAGARDLKLTLPHTAVFAQANMDKAGDGADADGTPTSDAPVYTQIETFFVPVGPKHPHDPAVAASPPHGAEDADTAAASTSAISAAGRKRARQAAAASGSNTYVLTDTVARHLRSLARAAVTRKYPVLLQGPTSSGKTSIVEYLAARTGHTCVRINNHDHTDIAEYIGSYAPDASGKLVFQEGLLVSAVRRGWWLILDELNLAPSEVLEALNRLLDDNRELFIPDTQETVKPHPHFMLFATQNPPGAYGGRKRLSNAFRNRFLELHVGDLPPAELKDILVRRTSLAPPFASAMVGVLAELQRQRTATAVFAGKEGFITTRDLLRWAGRRPTLWPELASAGYMLLAERLRSDAESALIARVLEAQCKQVKIDTVTMYACEPAVVEEDSVDMSAKRSRNEGIDSPSAGATPRASDPVTYETVLTDDSPEQYEMQRLVAGLHWAAGVLAAPSADSSASAESSVSGTAGTAELPRVPGTEGLSNISWTSSLRRLFVLLAACIRHSEPVLLVGETGCGKTTVVQLLALLLGRPLHIVNCHAHTETADFLGGLRPVRGRAKADAAFRGHLAAFVATCPSSIIASAFGAVVPAAAAAEAHSASEHAARPNTAWVHDPAIQVPSLAKALATAAKAVRKLDAATAAKQHSLDAVTWPEAQRGALAHASSAADAAGRFVSLFEWVDGPLVTAMKRGHLFLLDEASLAEDAVLERLNSVLEPSRTVTLAEAGGSAGDAPTVTAATPFRFFATMNPGGDFGKRELSPALRNRFTELWVPAITKPEDLLTILQDKLSVAAGRAALKAAIAAPALAPEPFVRSLLAPLGPIMLQFVQWLKTHAQGGHLVKPKSECALEGAAATESKPPGISSSRREVFLSLRDLHTWAQFVAAAVTNVHFVHSVNVSAGMPQDRLSKLHAWVALVHGACLVLLDGLGLGTNMALSTAAAIRNAAFAWLIAAVPEDMREAVQAQCSLLQADTIAGGSEVDAEAPLLQLQVTDSSFGLAPFSIKRGTEQTPKSLSYALTAPTTGANLLRLLRALQLSKPILLEGSPGVGKTSLVSSLAAASGHKLVRINLSEQTDMADLMGSDLPVPGSGADGGSPRFKWADGILLAALRAGHWVLLDEMNLASQAVLEGLNSVLDHRGTVFVPELDANITAPPSFRVFAAQNPISQGGGRKGLPKSFLNRFTKVVVSPLARSDLLFITHSLYPQLAACPPTLPPSEEHPHDNLLAQMIEFNCRVAHDTMVARTYGRSGAPWEFNLRDLFRWCDVTLASQGGKHGLPGTEGTHCTHYAPHRTAAMLYSNRMRTAADTAAINRVFLDVFGMLPEGEDGSAAPDVLVTPARVVVGDAVLPRRAAPGVAHQNDPSLSLRGVLPAPLNGDATVLSASMRHTLQAMAHSVAMNWPLLLMGGSGAGKTAAVRSLAQLVRAPFREIPLSPSTDATELLGCFEQWDPARHAAHAISDLRRISDEAVRTALTSGTPESMHTASTAAAGVAAALSAMLMAAPKRGGSMTAPAVAGALQLVQSLAAWSDTLQTPNGQSKVQQAVDAAAVLGSVAVKQGVPLPVHDAQACCDGVGTKQGLLLPTCAAHVGTLKAAISAAKGAVVTPTSMRVRGGAFEWVDGDLVNALERGEWVLLDNANFCSGSVLDRLNALLEPNGVLVVNEAGLVDGQPRTVKPHPDFRLFLAVDAGHGGEVSRAMRNRCIELSLAMPHAPPAHTPALGSVMVRVAGGVQKPAHLLSYTLTAAAHVCGSLSAAELIASAQACASGMPASAAASFVMLHAAVVCLGPLRRHVRRALRTLGAQSAARGTAPKWSLAGRSAASAAAVPRTTLAQLQRMASLCATLALGGASMDQEEAAHMPGVWGQQSALRLPIAVDAAFAAVYSGLGAADAILLLQLCAAVAEDTAVRSVERTPTALLGAALDTLAGLFKSSVSSAEGQGAVSGAVRKSASPVAAVHFMAGLAASLAASHSWSSASPGAIANALMQWTASSGASSALAFPCPADFLLQDAPGSLTDGSGRTLQRYSSALLLCARRQTAEPLQALDIVLPASLNAFVSSSLFGRLLPVTTAAFGAAIAWLHALPAAASNTAILDALQGMQARLRLQTGPYAAAAADALAFLSGTSALGGSLTALALGTVRSQLSNTLPAMEQREAAAADSLKQLTSGPSAAPQLWARVLTSSQTATVGSVTASSALGSTVLLLAASAEADCALLAYATCVAGAVGTVAHPEIPAWLQSFAQGRSLMGLALTAHHLLKGATSASDDVTAVLGNACIKHAASQPSLSALRKAVSSSVMLAAARWLASLHAAVRRLLTWEAAMLQQLQAPASDAVFASHATTIRAAMATLRTADTLLRSGCVVADCSPVEKASALGQLSVQWHTCLAATAGVSEAVNALLATLFDAGVAFAATVPVQVQNDLLQASFVAAQAFGNGTASDDDTAEDAGNVGVLAPPPVLAVHSSEEAVQGAAAVADWFSSALAVSHDVLRPSAGAPGVPAPVASTCSLPKEVLVETPAETAGTQMVAMVQSAALGNSSSTGMRSANVPLSFGDLVFQAHPTLALTHEWRRLASDAAGSQHLASVVAALGSLAADALTAPERSTLAALTAGAVALWQKQHAARLADGPEPIMPADELREFTKANLPVPPALSGKVLIQLTLASLHGEEDSHVGGLTAAGEDLRRVEVNDDNTETLRVLSESPRAEALSHVWAGLSASPAFAWWALRTERCLLAQSAALAALAASVDTEAAAAAAWSNLRRNNSSIGTWLRVALERAGCSPLHTAPWRSIMFITQALGKSSVSTVARCHIWAHAWRHVHDTVEAQWHIAAWSSTSHAVDATGAVSTVSCQLSAESVMQPEYHAKVAAAASDQLQGRDISASTPTVSADHILGGFGAHVSQSLQGPVSLMGSFAKHFAFAVTSPLYRQGTAGHLAHENADGARSDTRQSAECDTTGGALAQDVGARYTQLAHLGTSATLFSRTDDAAKADVAALLTELARTLSALVHSADPAAHAPLQIMCKTLTGIAQALLFGVGSAQSLAYDAPSCAASVQALTQSPDFAVSRIFRAVSTQLAAAVDGILGALGGNVALASAAGHVSQAWVCLGLVRVQLLCPTSASDPLLQPQWRAAALVTARDAACETAAAMELAELLARSAVGARHPLDAAALLQAEGSDESHQQWHTTPRALQTFLAACASTAGAASTNVQRDCSAADAYTRLAGDAAAAIRSVVSPQRVQGTLQLLLNASSQDHAEAALSQEAQWQESVGSALGPLYSQWAYAFPDVLMPVLAAAGQLAHGMRCAALLCAVRCGTQEAQAAAPSILRSVLPHAPAWVRVVRTVGPLLRTLMALPLKVTSTGVIAQDAFGAGALLTTSAANALDDALAGAAALPNVSGVHTASVGASRAAVLRAAVRRAVLAIAGHSAGRRNSANSSAVAAVTSGTATAQAWGLTTLAAVVSLWRDERDATQRKKAAREEAAAIAPAIQRFSGVSEEEQAEVAYRELFPDHREEFESLAGPTATDMTAAPEPMKSKRQLQEEAEDEAQAVADAAGARLSQADALALTAFVQLHAQDSAAVSSEASFVDALHAAAHSSSVAAHTLLEILPPSVRFMLQHPAVTALPEGADGSSILLVIRDAFIALGSRAVSMLTKGAGKSRKLRRRKRARKGKKASAAALRVFAPVSDEETSLLMQKLLSPVLPPPAAAAGWYDFHRDGHPAELKLAVPVLRRFQTSVFALLHIWPGNAVLSLLARMTDRVLRLPLASPLSKAVTGLELLLSKAEEWVATSPRVYHMAEEVKPLKQLVTRWRRLELASWPHLLRVKEVHFTQAASEWVYHLHMAMTEAPAVVMQAAWGSSLVHAAQTLAPLLSFGHGLMAGMAAAAPHAAWASPLLPHGTVQLLGSMQDVTSTDKQRGDNEGQDDRTATGTKYIGDASTAVPAAAIEGLPGFKEQQVHIASIFDTLERFLRTSPLGELAARVALLQSFGRLLASDVLSQLHSRVLTEAKRAMGLPVDRHVGHRKPTLMHARVAALVQGLVGWYAQFVPRAVTVLASLAGPVQRDLKDAVKIAKWDERNYYSLKASAERSSRMLANIVRKYEDILRSPGAQVLNADPDPSATILSVHAHASLLRGNAIEEGAVASTGVVQVSQAFAELAGELKLSPVQPVDGAEDNSAWHLGRGGQLYKRMWQLLQGNARFNRGEGLMSPAASLARDASTVAVNDLASAIVKRAASLRSGVSPRAQKHKTFVDFMKALREQGIPYHAGAMPRVMDHARSLLDMPNPSNGMLALHTAWGQWEATSSMQGALAPLAGLTRPLLKLWARCDDYYNRNIDAVVRARLAANSQPHSDLTPREVQLSRGLTDNLMLMCVQQRSVLGAASSNIAAALVLSRQLHTVQSSIADSNVQAVPYAAALVAFDTVHGALADARAYLLQMSSVLVASHAVAVASDGQLDMDLASAAAVPMPEMMQDEDGDTDLAATAPAAAPPVLVTASAVAEDAEALGSNELAAISSNLSALVKAANSEISEHLHVIASSMTALQSDVACVAAATVATSPQEDLADEAIACANALLIAPAAVNSSLNAALESLQDTVYSLEEFMTAPSTGSDSDPYVVAARNQALAAAGALDGMIDAVQQAQARWNEAVSTKRPLTAALVSSSNSLVGNVLLAVQRSCAGSGSATDLSRVRTPLAVLASNCKLSWGTSSLVSQSSGAAPIAPASGAGEEGDADARPAEDALAGTEVHLMAQHMACASSWASLSMPAVLAAGMQLLCAVGEAPAAPAVDAATAVAALEQAKSMLNGVLGAAVDLLQDTVVLAGHTGKLTYVAARTVCTLYRDGFCVPAEDDGKDEGDGDGQGNFEAAQDGTGMGEGDGAKDVSDQIDNEDQVAGLQGEEAPLEDETQQKEDGQEDTGIEMSTDFEGAMQDMPDQGDGNDDDGDDGEEEELDRQMGDTGEEDDAVDQRLWDGDDEEEDGPEQGGETLESSEQLAGDKEEAATDEVRAKEEDSKAPKGEEQGQAQPQEGDDSGDESGNEEEEHPGDAEYDDEGPDVTKLEGGDDGGEDEQGEDGLDLDDMQLDNDDSGDEGADGDDGEEGEEGEGYKDPLDKAGADQEAGGEQEDAEGEDAPDGPADDGPAEQEGEDDAGDDGDAALDEEAAEGAEDEAADGGAEDEQGDESDTEAPTDPLQQQDALEAEMPAAEDEGGEQAQPEEAGEEDAAADKERDQAEDATQQPAGQGLQSQDGNDRADVSAAQDDAAEAETEEGQEAKDAAAATDAAEAEDAQPDEQKEALKDAASASQPQQDDDAGAGDDDQDASGGAAGTEGQWQQLAMDPQGGGAQEQGKRQQRSAPLPLPSAPEDEAMDPASALQQWQVRLQELQGAEDHAGGEDTQAGEEDGGGNGGGDMDAVLNEAGGAHMLAPAVQQDGDEDSAGEDEDAVLGDEGGDDAPQAEDEDGDVQLGDSVTQQADGGDGDVEEDEDGEAGDASQQLSMNAAARSGKQQDEDTEAAEDAEDAQLHDDEGVQHEEELPQHQELADVLAAMQAEAKAEEAEVGAADGYGQDAAAITNTAAAGAGADEARDELLEEEQATALREQFDDLLAEWEGGDASDTAAAKRERATEAWSALTALTSDSSSSLCESLRLVLEPTLASRLAGDYRTGKRINMKKVIPYIASNFRKDAIWLRRTKPSQRTYQVLLAVDDSQSMRDNGACSMACEAMAVMAKALSALEVGQLGIMAFGKEAQLLHPLDAPFDDDAGARVISQLTFAQNVTATAGALQQIVSVMSGAAAAGKAAMVSAASGSNTVMQLVFMISDGILAHGSREDIKKWVIECAARNQLLVLVIVDKANPKESVLHMNRISFQGTRVVQNAYLDEYPFPYYLIVRDVAALPLALADALKQWFDMLAHAGDTAASM